MVTISFNQGEFLARAIDSVLGQAGRIQYIVCDPGSTDGSRAIIDSYGAAVAERVYEQDEGPRTGSTGALPGRPGTYSPISIRTTRSCLAPSRRSRPISRRSRGRRRDRPLPGHRPARQRPAPGLVGALSSPAWWPRASTHISRRRPSSAPTHFAGRRVQSAQLQLVGQRAAAGAFPVGRPNPGDRRVSQHLSAARDQHHQYRALTATMRDNSSANGSSG